VDDLSEFEAFKKAAVGPDGLQRAYAVLNGAIKLEAALKSAGIVVANGQIARALREAERVGALKYGEPLAAALRVRGDFTHTGAFPSIDLADRAVNAFEAAVLLLREWEAKRKRLLQRACCNSGCRQPSAFVCSEGVCERTACGTHAPKQGNFCAVCNAWFCDECAENWDSDEQMPSPGELGECDRCHRIVCDRCTMEGDDGFDRLCVRCAERAERPNRIRW